MFIAELFSRAITLQFAVMQVGLSLEGAMKVLPLKTLGELWRLGSKMKDFDAANGSREHLGHWVSG